MSTATLFNATWPQLHQTWIEQHGEACGARADARGPIGGGSGYTEIPKTTAAPIDTLDGLLDALASARPGDVIFLDGRAEIDCTARVYVERMLLGIPGGVTLASDRGRDGSPGALLCCNTLDVRPLLCALGPDVRISGLRIAGPNPRRCMDHHHRSFAEGSGRGRDYYYRFPIADGIATEHGGLTVDNCEIGGWSHGAIFLQAGTGHHIHHNFIHHNQYNGLGYGISLDQAHALIERNLFNYNRHSIAGTGRSGCGYEACHNVELEHSLSHCFDMHGGRDRQDGTNVAGTHLHIHHNTFGCEELAIKVRGVPEETSEIHHNWFFHATSEEAVVVEEQVEIYQNALNYTVA